MVCRRCRYMMPRCTLILALLSNQGLAFLRPPACSFSPLHHASKAQSTASVQYAAVAGGTSDGKVDRGDVNPPAESNSDKKTVPSALPPPVLKREKTDTSARPAPSGLKQRGVEGKVATGTVVEALKEDESSMETESGSVLPSAKQEKGIVVAGETVEQKSEKQAAPDSIRKDAPAVSAAREKKATAAKAGGNEVGKGLVGSKSVDSPAVETKTEGASAAAAAAGEEAPVKAAKVAVAKKKFKKTSVVAAAPETTAAEKVLSLLDLGLVDKDEVAAYFDALSDLERTTREAKEATTRSPVPSSTPKQSTQHNPLSLVPFPVVCAALGAAGAHSLQLTGELDTAASACGGIAGAALGSLLVVGDDAVGRTARALGAGIAGTVGVAGGLAGKSVSESAAGAAGAAVTAVEEAVIKAPVNFAGGVVWSISETLSAVIKSVVNLPGALAKKVVDEAKRVLQETSEAAFRLPGEIAQKASDAAGGALRSTSEATITAVKDSPKEAAKRLKAAVSAPGDALKEAVASPEKVLGSVASFTSRMPGAAARGSTMKEQVRPTIAAESGAAAQKLAPVASIDDDEEQLEGLPIEELEAKMTSVQEALERFDAVKNRIARAQTSGTLLETVGMTRSIDLTAERERGEAARAAAKREREGPTGSEDGVRRRASQASKATLEQEPIDEGRRKRVAENLLEKASQRAAAAKAELKAAAASARREAETGGSDDDSTATATSEAAKTTPQVVGGAASG